MYKEFVQKLDIYANEAFKRAIEHVGVCCAVVSEEDEEPFLIPSPSSGAILYVSTH